MSAWTEALVIPGWAPLATFSSLGNEPPAVHRDETRRRLGWGSENVVLHAGNMGAKQGLEHVVDAAARLSRGDQVAGLPGGDARKLMRRFGDGQPESVIGSWIDIGSRTGTEVARAFADAGYLRAAHAFDGETYWETTIRGNALGQASFGRPITRATAERHLAGVIDRTKVFNADGSHLLDALLWPEKEALLMLRNRSAYINITLENVRTLTGRWEVVYRYDV